ncbi:MAG: NifU family protein [Deltaproteobacteria bacterium]|nr:NifU family protein [Deltaproteobacteria bacterium]
MDTTQIKIIAEPQTLPENCRFTLENPLLEGPSVRFSSGEETKGSALAEKIFACGNVQGILIAGNSVTVTQNGTEDWRMLGKKIGAAIREAISERKPLVSKEVLSKIPESSKIQAKVVEVIQNQINPAIASHGGYIELLEVKNNDIYVKMGGGCHGCAMSSATLKQGVEQTLRKEIPEIGAIYDTTDHASGANPYYSPGK